MIHYLHAYSPTLDQELSQFEFHGMTGGEHTQHTTAAEAQAYADEFAAMLSESKHLGAADWQGRIKTA